MKRHGEKLWLVGTLIAILAAVFVSLWHVFVFRTRPAVAVGGQSATHVLGPDNFTNADDWLTVASLGGTGIQAFAYDSVGQILYAVGLGTVYRCDIGGTGCDDSGDWTTTYAVTDAAVSVILDPVNRILYAGSSSGGVIVRCDIVATGCDATGDWTTSFDTPFERVSAIVVGDGILYAGVAHSMNETSVYRCDTATVGSCDDAGDWTDITPAVPSGGRINALTYDGTNHVVYAGYIDSGPIGYILRCNFTGTSCDAGADWTTTTVTSDPVRAFAIDGTNHVIYAGTDNKIIRCDITATACDASGDWVVSFNSAHFSDSLVWDPTTQAIYSGDNNSNILYRCSIAETGCDSDGDWRQATANFVGGIALVRDSVNNVLYSASSGPNVNRCAASSGCNTTELTTPRGIAEDATGHRLFVADASNNRVLVYDTSGFTDGQEPVNELGQADMNDVLCNRFGSAGANTLCNPSGLAYDSANQRLFVSDTDNNRVLVYDVASITDGEPAVHVLGQANFTNTGIPSEPGPSDLQVTRGLAYDSVHHRLFVSNSGACEVFVFDVTSITDGDAAVSVLGGNDDFSPGACTANDNSLNFPFGVAYDVTGDRLFVADRDNNRIMVFDVASITNDEPAVKVLGQPNFTSNFSNTNISGLTLPADAAYDSSSASLFVSDSGSSRAMVWDVSSITNGEDAVDVFGQTDFDSGGSATTQSSFSGPSGVALGSLFVADTSNNRIMVFGAAPTPTPTPVSGGGGVLTTGFVPKFIRINDDSSSTSDRNVLVTVGADVLPAFSGTVDVALSNDSQFRNFRVFHFTVSDPKGQAWARTVGWDLCLDLPPGRTCDPGQKVTYARFYVNTPPPVPLGMAAPRPTAKGRVIRRTNTLVFNEDWCRDDTVSNVTPTTASLTPANANSCAGTFNALSVFDGGPGGRRVDLPGRSQKLVATLQSLTTPVQLNSNTFSLGGGTDWTAASCRDIYGNGVTNIRVYPNGPGGGFGNFNTGAVGGSFQNFNTTTFGPYAPGIHDIKTSVIIGHGVDPRTGRGRGSCDVAEVEFKVNVPAPQPAPSIPAGTIQGVCKGWPSPRVEIRWSDQPPPGSLPKNSNSVKRSDDNPLHTWIYAGGWPGVWATRIDGSAAAPWGPSGYPQPNYAVYDLKDTAVQNGHTYDYVAKYRPETSSVNSYTITVNSANCGGPPQTPTPQTPLTVSPRSQTIPPNISAVLTARGGTGVYSWSAPQGNPSTGSGQTFAPAFTNGSSSPVTKTVSLTSGASTVTATVTVQGIQTFSDDINLAGIPQQTVVINGDAPATTDPSVTLTLAHGFAGVATSSVTVRLSDTPGGLAAAPARAFTRTVAGWDLCGGRGACPSSLYSVYARYEAPGVPSRMALDSIVLDSAVSGPSAVLINGGAAVANSTAATVQLRHNFSRVADEDVGMQISNTVVDLASQPVQAYAAAVPWNLCQGLGASCSSGTRTVYARFTHAALTAVASDAIDLVSSGPLWGVFINDDALGTATPQVALRLNPLFRDPATVVLVSNTPDFEAAPSRPYADTMPWDLCAGLSSCNPELPYRVYVRYVNPGHPEWQASDWSDDILYSLTAATPTPTPSASPVILINDGNDQTSSRYVRLKLNSPFTGTGVTMRPVNADQLLPDDRDLLADRKGGVPSQPDPTPLPVAPEKAASPLDNIPVSPPLDLTPAAVRNRTLPLLTGGISAGAFPQTIPELKAGTERPFTAALAGWDLCQGQPSCPYGLYRVYVQYYRPTAAAARAGTFAALGDEASDIYEDSILYATPAPSVTPTGTPLPSGTPAPSPLATPTASGSPVPSGPPAPAGPVPLPAWVPPVVQSFIQATSGASGVIAPVSFAAAVAVAASAALALVPLVGPGVAAFAWQWFMGALGLLPKRKKTWGTIYDANTKRPIPFARVQLLDRNKRVLETRVADKDGRYGFLTTPESLLAQRVQIYIQPVREGYLFPSRTPASIDTFVYNNLYYGDLIEVNDQTLINFDVPMDPVRPSAGPLLLKSPSIALGASVAAIADAGFWLGLFLVPLNFVLSPNPFTFGTLCLFLGTASLRLFGISEHPFGVVKDAATGRPMPFALITLNDISGRRVGFAVSDEQGRYFIVAERGMYQLTVFTPAAVVPPRQSVAAIEAKKGWITREIKV